MYLGVKLEQRYRERICEIRRSDVGVVSAAYAYSIATVFPFGASRGAIAKWTFLSKLSLLSKRGLSRAVEAPFNADISDLTRAMRVACS